MMPTGDRPVCAGRHSQAGFPAKLRSCVARIERSEIRGSPLHGAMAPPGFARAQPGATAATGLANAPRGDLRRGDRGDRPCRDAAGRAPATESRTLKGKLTTAKWRFCHSRGKSDDCVRLTTDSQYAATQGCLRMVVASRHAISESTLIEMAGNPAGPRSGDPHHCSRILDPQRIRGAITG
jgi:hypothetical protein